MTGVETTSASDIGASNERLMPGASADSPTASGRERTARRPAPNDTRHGSKFGSMVSFGASVAVAAGWSVAVAAGWGVGWGVDADGVTFASRKRSNDRKVPKLANAAVASRNAKTSTITVQLRTPSPLSSSD